MEDLLEDELAEALMVSKLDGVAQEYNHLLVSQLDSQRQYFEGLMASVQEEAAARVVQVGQGLGYSW